MTREAAFWRNLAVIGLFHLAILFGIAQWSAATRKPLGRGIVWMERGADQPLPAASPQLQVQETEPEPPPPTEEEKPKVVEEPEEQPVAQETATEHSLATPTAAPKSTPKPIPKKAKAARPAKVKKPAVKKTSKPAPKVTPKKEEPSKSSRSAGTGRKAGSASQFSWYGNMLHDRFFSSWDQPTSVVATGAKMSVLVRLRIEKDGRVSSFALVRPSGNVVVDESVAAVAKRVTQVDPLPAGLGSGGHYDVNINFELNAN